MVFKMRVSVIASHPVFLDFSYVYIIKILFDFLQLIYLMLI